MTNEYFIGVDVGSISTNVAVIDQDRNIIETVYIRTEGKPINSVQRGIRIMREKLNSRFGKDIDISGNALSYFISDDFRKLAKRNQIDADMVRGAVGSLSAYPLLSRKKLANDMAKEIDAVWVKKIT